MYKQNKKSESSKCLETRTLNNQGAEIQKAEIARMVSQPFSVQSTSTSNGVLYLLPKMTLSKKGPPSYLDISIQFPCLFWEIT